MRRTLRTLLAIGTATGFAASARADAAYAAARQAAADATLAAVDVADDARPAAVARLDAARDAALAVVAESPAERRALDRLARRLAAASAKTADTAVADASAVRAIRRAAHAGHGVARALRTDADGPDVVERRRGDGFHRAGARVDFRVVGCDESPVVTVSNASAFPVRTFRTGVQVLGPRTFRVTLGPDLGGARVTVTACGVTRDWIVLNRGPRDAFGIARPLVPHYADTAVLLRAGVAAAPRSPTHDATAETFDVDPPLPAGVLFDGATGTISGTPDVPAPTAPHTVIARNRRGAASSQIDVEVAPALPAGVVALEDGFQAEVVAQGLDVPVKMAFAPDGRLFYSELVTGRVRIIDQGGTLLPEPFATVPVAGGGERGLLGIAIAPDFAASGHVFVFAATAADAVLPERSRYLRLTADGDTGGDLAVIVDSLPVGDSQNGGALAFGPDGKLYATIGDTGDPALAQADGARAGRILRFEADGSVPADNPIAGDPEWCRGLRNSFDIAFAPSTGGLFASENGPMANDELEFVQPGKNYGWGAAAESIPGPQVGYRMVDWSPVIVPTGITFLGRGAFGSEYATSLFVAGYDASDLRRVVLSGAALTDVDEELPFARWEVDGIANRPLDLAEAPDGSLFVSTFSAIWRITRY